MEHPIRDKRHSAKSHPSPAGTGVRGTPAPWQCAVLVLLQAGITSCYPASHKPVSPEPTLKVGKMIHDFGSIPDTGTVEAVFEMSNTGGKQLDIARIQTSCGCTAALMDSQSLKPGESSRMKLTFDPRGKRGRLSRDLWIISNDPANPKQHLSITADVVPAKSGEKLGTPQAGSSTATGESLNGWTEGIYPPPSE